MTKKELVTAIEKSNMVIDFDFNYLMKRSKTYLQSLYEHCCLKEWK